MKIRTNNQPRNILHGYDLPENLRKEFDYLSDEDFGCNDFFKYKGNYYDLGKFMRCPEGLKNLGWYGYLSDSFFSGVLIKYTDDYESVIVGTYYC